MSTLFAKARDWLPGKVREAAGVGITYARGAESIGITATVGRTVFSSLAEGAPRVEFGERDYLILAADLVIGGGTSEPAIGDRITETIDGSDVVFEVVTPETGEPAWRWSDPQRTVWRVHVKRQKQAES